MLQGMQSTPLIQAGQAREISAQQKAPKGLVWMGSEWAIEDLNL